MIWTLAIPGILMGLIPVTVALVFSYALVRLAYRSVERFVRHMNLYYETRYVPKIIKQEMSESEIRREYRKLDNKEKGYNPFRHDYALIELFPQKPVISKISEAAQRLFPQRYLQLMPKTKRSEYQVAHDLCLNMLIERQHQIKSGRWSKEKEKQWIEVPFLPAPMREIDDEYLNWCFMAIGHDEPKQLAS